MSEYMGQIKEDEGFRGKPYLDTVGKTTIGYGRNLDDNPLTKKEAEYLLQNDLNGVLKQALKLPYFSKLNHVRQTVIINMVFNIGITRFKKFYKANAALEKHDYETAADEMYDSKWRKQVKGRATRLIKQMREGV